MVKKRPKWPKKWWKNALAKVAILAISPKTSRSPCKNLHGRNGKSGKKRFALFALSALSASFATFATAFFDESAKSAESAEQKNDKTKTIIINRAGGYKKAGKWTLTYWITVRVRQHVCSCRYRDAKSTGNMCLRSPQWLKILGVSE